MASIRKLSPGKYQVQIRVQGMQSIYNSLTTKKNSAVFVKEVEADSEFQRKSANPSIR